MQVELSEYIIFSEKKRKQFQLRFAQRVRGNQHRHLEHVRWGLTKCVDIQGGTKDRRDADVGRGCRPSFASL